MLLQMQSVSASYGGKKVLDDINLIVSENDFIGVIGPNGGGKTTLLRLILGLMEPDNGKIIFNTSLLSPSQIGYLPQISTGDINFPVTVTDVVLSGLMIRKNALSRMTSDDREKARSIINELGLERIAAASLNQLSGGQLQKVFLGRAIIGNPKLLLLDEPGNFIDASFESDFYERLRDLNHRMAILMVSHDIGMISAHVKSYACVKGGLHYHPSSELSADQLREYGCPIQLITHGEIPHTVLKAHD